MYALEDRGCSWTGWLCLRLDEYLNTLRHDLTAISILKLQGKKKRHETIVVVAELEAIEGSRLFLDKCTSSERFHQVREHAQRYNEDPNVTVFNI